MKHFVASIIDAVFPPRCPCCDAVHINTKASPFCPTCFAATIWLGHGVTSDHFPDPAWHQAVAVCRFEGPITQALHQLKYQRRLDLARPLARLMADAVGVIEPFDLILPVPLAAKRLRERGFNQSLLLAKRLGRLMRCEVQPELLQRTREGGVRS